jgi:hypothetical protein
MYINVGNNMGSSSYYTCLVKIANSTDYYPDTSLGKPSELPALYEYKQFVGDGLTSELPLTFQVNGLEVADGVCRLTSISINGVTVPLNETSALNSDGTGFYYAIIVELWIFNSTIGTSVFHNKFVAVPLNMTQ